MQEYLNEAQEMMEMAILHVEDELARIRAGKANTRILDGIRVDSYGTMVPLTGVASITTPDARTIAIKPWDKNMFRVIEKAIIDSPVGITPENNGEIIRLGIPPLTEERRKQLAKQCKEVAENAKISIRNARRDCIDALKKAVKDGMPYYEPHRSRQFATQPEQRPYAAKTKQSGNKWFVVILFIVIIAVIGGVIAYLWFDGGGVTNVYGTPRKTVDRMLSSWAKGKYIETRSCMHPAMASDFDYDDFDDLKVYSYSIERVEQSGSSATVWVDISTNDGWYEDQEVSLIKDGDRWRVTDL